jgi:GT2 family glycosyltransferase
VINAVIPSKTPDNMRAAVQSIRNHEPINMGVYVIDDGLNCETAAIRASFLAGAKPFVFSRNCNMGLREAFDAGAHGVFLMNDDATLETPGGFTALAGVAAEHPGYGLVSAAIRHDIGNLRQRPQGNGLREEPNMVCFVCVYIPRKTWETVGPLDERFTAYGWDDTDYCRRVRNAGLKIGIFDGCHVEHGKLQSSFRPGNRAVNVYNDSARAYLAKHGDLAGLAVPQGWKEEER